MYKIKQYGIVLTLMVQASTCAPGRDPALLPWSPSDDGNGVLYGGGRVVAGTARLYVLWYGPWEAVRRQRLRRTLFDLSGSDWLATLTTYHDGAGARPSGRLALVDELEADGPDLTDAAQAERLLLPFQYDPGGIYYIMVSAERDAFGACAGRFLGFHTLTQHLKPYAVVQDVARCLPQLSVERSLRFTQDVAAHETAEVILDPEGTAWALPDGREPADACEGRYGSSAPDATGELRDLTLNGEPYMLQYLWVNARSGGCAMGPNEPLH